MRQAMDEVGDILERLEGELKKQAPHSSLYSASTESSLRRRSLMPSLRESHQAASDRWRPISRARSLRRWPRQ